jgi:hypothetical protein
MDSSAQLAVLQASHVLSIFVGLGCSIAILVVVATVVRRHRPDAHGPLLGWAIAGLAVAIVLPALHIGSRAIRARDDFETLLTTQIILGVLGTVLQVVLVVLLVRGLVKLAQPPKPVVTDPEGPYR